MKTVTVNDVKQISLLARIQLPEQDLQRLTEQLDEILGYVRQLQAVPTDGIEPTSHVLPLANITRPDELRPSMAPERLLSGAPQRHGPYVRVPKIIET